MGFNSVLTPDDLLKGELIEVGWHPAELVSYEEREAETDKSTNIILGFKVIDGKEKGKSANKLFSEKALGFGKNLWAIIIPGFDKVKGGNLNDQIIRAAVGKKLKIYVKRGKSSKGNDFNDVVDFMPLT